MSSSVPKSSDRMIEIPPCLSKCQVSYFEALYGRTHRSAEMQHAIDRSAEMLVQPGGVAKSYKKREESKERREEARGKRGK